MGITVRSLTRGLNCDIPPELPQSGNAKPMRNNYEVSSFSAQ